MPAIALTAYVADHDRDRSLAAGFQLHLGKPTDPGLLVQAIADVVGRRRALSARLSPAAPAASGSPG